MTALTPVFAVRPDAVRQNLQPVTDPAVLERLRARLDAVRSAKAMIDESAATPVAEPAASAGAARGRWEIRPDGRMMTVLRGAPIGRLSVAMLAELQKNEG